MAIKMIKKEYPVHLNTNEFVCTLICDTAADVANLQTEHPNCGTGSMALVIDTGDVYVVNTSGKWVVFGG